MEDSLKILIDEVGKSLDIVWVTHNTQVKWPDSCCRTHTCLFQGSMTLEEFHTRTRIPMEEAEFPTNAMKQRMLRDTCNCWNYWLQDMKPRLLKKEMPLLWTKLRKLLDWKLQCNFNCHSCRKLPRLPSTTWSMVRIPNQIDITKPRRQPS